MTDHLENLRKDMEYLNRRECLLNEGKEEVGDGIMIYLSRNEISSFRRVVIRNIAKELVSFERSFNDKP